MYLGHVQVDIAGIFQAGFGIIFEYFVCLAIFAILWRLVNRTFFTIFTNIRETYFITGIIYLICYLAYFFGGPINIHSH